MTHHVLVIEDDPVDFRLIQEMVAAGAGEAFDLLHVRNLADGLNRLSQDDVELVVLDLNLPDSLGLETFTRLQPTAGSRPVIIISSLGNLNLAIQAVQAGAQDYLLKDRLQPEPLIRAMHYAIQRKHLEQRLKEAEWRHRTIFEVVSDMVLVSDWDGNIIEVNSSSCQVFGASRQELLQKKINEILPREAAPMIYQQMASPKKTLPQEACETVCFNLRGESIPVEVVAREEKADDQDLVVFILRDLRGRKKAEEAYQVLVENSLQGLLIIQDERIAFANPAALESSGYSLQEATGFSAEELLQIVYPEDRLLVTQELTSVMEKQQVRPVLQFRIQRKDGSLCWMEALVAPVEYRLKPGLQVSLLDITEHKKAEQRLRQRLAIESLVTSLSSHFISVPYERISDEINRALQSLGEFSNADRCYLNLFADDQVTIHSTYEWHRPGLKPKTVLRTGTSVGTFQWSMEKLHQGEAIFFSSLNDLPTAASAEKEVWEKWNVQSMLILPLIMNQQLKGILGFSAETGKKTWAVEDFHLVRIMGGIFLNVLARRQAEESLRQAQQNLDWLMSSVSDCLWSAEIDRQGQFRLLYVSPVIERITGYPAQSFLKDTEFALHVVYPDDFERVREAYTQVISGQGTSLEIEYRILHLDGVMRWLRDSATSTREPNGHLRLSSVISDITERKQAEEYLHQANRHLQETVTALERRNLEAALLNELGDLLQGCLNSSEVYDVVEAIAPRLFSDYDGALFIHSHSRRFVEMAASWGKTVESETVFEPEKCWALRRGRQHFAGKSSNELNCRHINSLTPVSHTCTPLVAQGEMIGLLYLQAHQPVDPSEQHQQLVTIASERVAMALANLRLRDSLQIQSVHDALTGLFNRKYMEETTLRELRRAARQKHSIGFIMLDIDRFKQYNDRYGHGAGDELLQALGIFLQNKIRGSDIACRYGGDEFMLVLPEASLQDTSRRAEELRQAAKKLTVQYRGTELGMVTLSIGISSYPEHGDTLEVLVHVADMELYRSKNTGGDQVSVAVT